MRNEVAAELAVRCRRVERNESEPESGEACFDRTWRDGVAWRARIQLHHDLGCHRRVSLHAERKGWSGNNAPGRRACQARNPVVRRAILVERQGHETPYPASIGAGPCTSRLRSE